MVWLLASGVYEKGKVDFVDLVRWVFELVGSGEVGAVAFFVGVAKKMGKGEEKEVVVLEMESYVEHANRAIARICEEVRSKYSLSFVGIWHLVGRFEVGEPVVMVVATGVSREPVFNGLREAVERYKREPALFKKEVYVDGSYKWIEGA